MDRAMVFPDDVVVEILSWLPVKPVTKCKIVSKGWCSFIRSKAFIEKHMKNYGGNVINNSLILREYTLATKENRLSLCSQDDGGDLFIDYCRKPHKDRSLRILQMAGPCNGIFCLYAMVDEITLWNPAIREVKVLPRSSILRPSGITGSFVGFGFDSVTSDYKVVQLVCCSDICNTRRLFQVEIYSLSTNSWRSVGNPVGLIRILTQYNAINYSASYQKEVYCWLALVSCNNSQNRNGVQYKEVVLSLDMCNDVFQTTLLPLEDLQLTRTSQGDVDQGNALVAELFPLHDSLALVVSNHPRRPDPQLLIQIWTIKDVLRAEGRSSWTKISIVGPFSGVDRPLALWRGNNYGNLFLILRKFNGDLVYCDCNSYIVSGGKIVTREIMGLDMQSTTSASWIFPNYIDTLVSFNTL